MPQTLKTITPKHLLQFLPTYKGSPLPSTPILPPNFTALPTSPILSLRKQFLYHDFKQAWSYFTLFSTTCYKLGYRPALYNVYNKVIVECYSVNEGGLRQVTTKDLFVAYLLNQLGGNQGEGAYRRALEGFRGAV